ncbi:MAG: AMP-dependent synthetase/ligase [Solirubrobacteraceae bacterium]|nr:AMP-dependent synthetase/ligase [Solirubrobacteraceae bacterium]
MTHTAPRTATIGDLLLRTAAEHGGRPALRTLDGTTAWTWAAYADRARASAAALAGLGVGRGDTVALWLTNRPEFHAIDAGAALLGAAPFSIYATFTAEQAEHVVGDAGSRILVTEPQFLERALAVRDGGRTALERVVLVDGAHDDALAWDAALDASPAGFDVDAAAAAVEPDDLVTLIYTSGTTGPPKGVELTHGNVVAQIAALTEAVPLEREQAAISWLPMAHVAERMCTHYIPMALAWQVTCQPDPREIASTLAAVRPEFFFSPPRLWQKLRSAIVARMGDSPDPAVALAAVGLDRVRASLVGAAPCSPDVIAFWNGLGLPLCEVYGLSETTAVATVDDPRDPRLGTVGRAVPGVEVVLSDDGEVLVRGPVIMRGYRNLPDKTAEEIDPDGWLRTGDVGEIDDDGYLRIVDRMKELIINAAGKNMSPANIEATVKSASPLIGNVCCVGDARPYNVALITLDPDARPAFAGREDDEIAAAVERANERLARVEQIKRFHVLDEDWVPGGVELTPTMKLKRKPIAEAYAAEIEALYAAKG